VDATSRGRVVVARAGNCYNGAMAEKTEARVDPRDVGRLLGAATAVLRSELTALPPAALSWHLAPGEWCAKEVLGHLIEAERRGFAGRIRIILEHPTEPTFERWEPDAVARERRDCERDVAGLLDEFAALRKESVALANCLRDEELGRGGQHPAVGRLTIRDLLHEWVHHDRNHIRQILANVQAYVWPAMGNAQRFSQE
jgi:hypothetical protein